MMQRSRSSFRIAPSAVRRRHSMWCARTAGITWGGWWWKPKPS